MPWTIAPAARHTSAMNTASHDIDAPVQPLPARYRGLSGRLLVALGLAGVGGVLFVVDLPVARWCREHRLPGDLGRLIDLSEAFAHSLSVAVILIVTATLDPVLRHVWRLPTARWDMARLVAATYAGGLVVDGLKLAFTRVRPRAANFAGVTSVLETFGTAIWPLAATGGDALRAIGKSADLMSFPSGHAAVAAGLATALSWKYPHGTPAFVVLAAMAAAQRVFSSAHYPSDIAFGAACGVATAAVCLGSSRPTSTVLR